MILNPYYFLVTLFCPPHILQIAETCSIAATDNTNYRFDRQTDMMIQALFYVFSAFYYEAKGNKD